MLLLLLLLVCSSTPALSTRFLFGILVECSLPRPFHFSVQHKSEDAPITEQYNMTAVGKLFFYQDGMLISSTDMEPYAEIHHDCSNSGKWFKYQRRLWTTPYDKSVEVMEYKARIFNKEGTDYQKDDHRDLLFRE